MNNHPVSWQPGSRTRTRQAMSPSHVATGRARLPIFRSRACVCAALLLILVLPAPAREETDLPRGSARRQPKTPCSITGLRKTRSGAVFSWQSAFPLVPPYLSLCLLRLATNRHRHRHRHHHRHRHRHRHPSREMSYTGTHIRALHAARRSYSPHRSFCFYRTYREPYKSHYIP